MTSSPEFKVMLSAPYMQPVVERFRPIFETANVSLTLPKVVERLDETELLNHIQDVDGVICGDDKFTHAVLRSARRLRVIAKWGTGVDSIDHAAAEEFGIQVFRTPDAFSYPVADSVFCFILAFARNLLPMNSAMHAGEWRKISGKALNECALGIIGVGNVGRRVMERGAAFGMKILLNDIRPVETDLGHYEASQVELGELLENSDFVSVNCDLNPSSHHLISRAELKRMQGSAYLINTARGHIVDEHALVETLANGEIAGAGLDVFEQEPLPASSPLRRFENVLMSPHNSNSSPAAWERVHHTTIRNLFRGLGITITEPLSEMLELAA